MINLHSLASRAIGAVHGHERVTLVQSIGQVNEAGRIFAKYAEPFQLFAQIQSMGSDELAHFEKTDSTKIYRKAWLNEPTCPVWIPFRTSASILKTWMRIIRQENEMSIPASQIVQVNPGLLTPGGVDMEFNGLLLSESGLIPASQMVLPFPDADSVGEYFGLESPEYHAATIYFQGYNNSFKKPRAFYIAARVARDRPAWLRSGRFTGTLAEINAISSGDLTLRVNGTEVTAGNIDFSGATSLSGAAQILQTAISQAAGSGNEIKVSYSSLTGSWRIESGVSGGNSEIGYASSTGGLASFLKLDQAGGAVVSPGMDALSEAANMQAILKLTKNFVCFTTLAKATKDEALAYAAWASGKGVDYLYIYWDDDPALCMAGAQATIADALMDANAGATCGVYDSADYAAMIMGTAASIDWNRRNGTITFAFKSQDGLAANVTQGTEALNLESRRMNFMGDYATRNDQFIFLYPGRMFGEWDWIDTYLNAVWLKNALQVACMNGFRNAPRVPYNEVGYSMVTAWLQDPVNRALYNGIIDTGVTLSESQKAELTFEAGSDISKTLFTDGVYIKIAEPSPQIRVARESPECSVWYTYGGSIHKLTVASKAIV